jgi:hypothetical protein
VVGDTWWVHDDLAYTVDPPREKVWYEGVVTRSHPTYFDVEIAAHERLPLTDCEIAKVTVVQAGSTSNPDELVRQATDSLYCIDFESVTQELLVRSPRDSPLARTRSLARKCAPREIDWFISHSWNDDPYEKWKVLKAEADSFKEDNGRWPVLWLDKVCLDQANIVQSLKCLPIYLLACKGMLILGGETYISRLWCIWELYSRFVLSDGKNKPNVVIREFQDNLALPVPSSALSAPPRLTLRQRLERFDLQADTKCYDPNEEANLLSTIRAAPGGEEAFNQTVRGLAAFLQDVSASRKPKRKLNVFADAGPTKAELTKTVADLRGEVEMLKGLVMANLVQPVPGSLLHDLSTKVEDVGATMHARMEKLEEHLDLFSVVIPTTVKACDI